MKQIATLSLILFVGLQTVHAQLGNSRSEITGKFGTNFYKNGTSKQGEPYIVYKIQDSTATSGSFTERVCFYFTKSDDGTEYCNEQLILDPLSELNYWVEYYRATTKKLATCNTEMI